MALCKPTNLSINKTIENNLHLWEEKEDLRAFVSQEALDNVPAQRYKGGELLLAKAKELDLRSARKVLEVGEELSLQFVDYLYLSAATFFFRTFGIVHQRLVSPVTPR